ncbi:MAG: ATPase, T2SS/T4P/T4SS family, partial [Acidimicrobiia bacterium]|nr:ATPase, T2SS/T4P/T4SS family [Acidimicrobiia bacterium]
APANGERVLHDPEEMVARVVRSIADFGPLTEILRRSGIEEIFIEGDRVAYIDESGKLRQLTGAVSEAENRHIIERLLAASDRRLDASSPIVQARVLDGTARLTAVIPPVADRLSATVRRYAIRRQTLPTLVELGSLSRPAAGLLWAAAQIPSRVVVSGPPGSGKTSLLSAMLAAAPPTQCVRCCEEVRELFVPLTHGSFYEARPASLDGTGEVDLRDLVKVVLAMRPDRIVIGEVRGAEAFELTRAVNAGCGFSVTVHANSAADALNALVNAAIMAGENVPDTVVRRIFASSIDLVVQLDRDDIPGDGGLRRRVVEILAMVPALTDDDFSTEPIFVRPDMGSELTWTGRLPPPPLADRLDAALRHLGFDTPAVLSGTAAPL